MSCYLCSVVICAVLCIVCVNVYCILPPGDNPIAVNKYFISYHYINTSEEMDENYEQLKQKNQVNVRFLPC